MENQSNNLFSNEEGEEGSENESKRDSDIVVEVISP